jgi:CheY-like chemotaxis protein
LLLSTKERRRKILIVDDGPDITLALRIGLEDNGFEVYTFNDPIEALPNFRTGYYDLLLLVIKIPKVNDNLSQSRTSILLEGSGKNPIWHFYESLVCSSNDIELVQVIRDRNSQ